MLLSSNVCHYGIIRQMNLAHSIKPSVTDFELNAPFAAEMFEIAYPGETVLFDRDKSEQWRISPDTTTRSDEVKNSTAGRSCRARLLP